MSRKINRPTKLFDKSVEFYSKNFKKVIKLCLLIPALGFLPYAIILGLQYSLRNDFPLASIIFAIAIFISMIFAIVISIGSSIGLISLLSEPETELSAKSLFEKSLPLVGSYFYLSLLVGVILLGLALLLVIPAIIYWVFYSLVFFVMVTENKRGFAALKRSKELVSGFWWAVFGRYVFLAVISIVFVFILGIPFLFITENSPLYYVWDLISQLIIFAIWPIGTAFSFFIYEELKNIKKSENEKS
jgi:hypothetical protein